MVYTIVWIEKTPSTYRLAPIASEEHVVGYNVVTRVLPWKYGNNDDNTKWDFWRHDIPLPWQWQRDGVDGVVVWGDVRRRATEYVPHTHGAFQSGTYIRLLNGYQVPQATDNCQRFDGPRRRKDDVHDMDDSRSVRWMTQEPWSEWKEEQDPFALERGRWGNDMLLGGDKPVPNEPYRAIGRFQGAF